MKTETIGTAAKRIDKTHKYRVAAWWTSGQAGIVKADSAPNVIHFTAPPEFRGLEAMWTPEELLLSALASCFTATFHVIAGYAKFEYTDLQVEAEGVVSKAELGYTFKEIIVRPTLTIAHEQQQTRALDLLQKAEMLCLVSRALSAPQRFEMRVNFGEISAADDPSIESAQPSKPAVQGGASTNIWPLTLKDRTDLLLRPICPDDEPMLVKFHETLSDRTVYFRYFHSISLKSRVAHERLARICFVDHDREIVLVADFEESKTGPHRILGVGRLNKSQNGREGAVAVLVSDHHQHRGLGTEMLRRLVQIARGEGLCRVSCEMLRENVAMQTLVKKLGFTVRLLDDPKAIKAFHIL
jgi:peroxiredoxin-like protein